MLGQDAFKLYWAKISCFKGDGRASILLAAYGQTLDPMICQLDTNLLGDMRDLQKSSSSFRGTNTNNPARSSVFLSAYNQTFDPSDLSEGYLGDMNVLSRSKFEVSIRLVM